MGSVGLKVLDPGDRGGSGFPIGQNDHKEHPGIALLVVNDCNGFQTGGGDCLGQGETQDSWWAHALSTLPRTASSLPGVHCLEHRPHTMLLHCEWGCGGTWLGSGQGCSSIVAA